MREVFFNSFKEKILNGKVPNMFDVHGTPVTSDFIDIFDNDEIKLEQYKTLDDFNKYANGNGTKTLEQTTFRYEEYGVEYSAYYNNDVSEKPIFVNLDNWEKFLKLFLRWERNISRFRGNNNICIIIIPVNNLIVLREPNRIICLMED